MFFWIALLQIVVYLFVMPALAVYLASDVPHTPSSFFVASTFAVTFLAGHTLTRRRFPAPPAYAGIHAFTPLGSIVIIGWSALHVYLCYKHGLYDRRIGTESIALLFSELSSSELLLIRLIELFLPYLVAVAVFGLLRDRNLLNVAVLCALSMSFLASGAINSRSQAVILGLSFIVIVQNLIDRQAMRRIVLAVAAVGVVVVAAVTANRIGDAEDVEGSLYARDEFVKRLDGLEITSLMIFNDGLGVFGTNPASLLTPILAAFPLSEEAAELKESALTTVKANILDLELFSSERDVNSFVITDIYYTGGVIGIVIGGVLLGLVARLIDSKIGATRRINVHLLLVAAVCNGLVLEREGIGIVIGTFRDWLLLVGLMMLLCRWTTIPKRVGARRRRVATGTAPPASASA